MMAIRYAHLVGKHIRMERPATRQEIREGTPHHVGMECYVALVRDIKEPARALFFVADDARRPPRPVQWRRGVEIVSDESIAFTVWEDEERDWGFMIWPDKDTAEEFMPEDDHAEG